MNAKGGKTGSVCICSRDDECMGSFAMMNSVKRMKFSSSYGTRSDDAPCSGPCGTDDSRSGPFRSSKFASSCTGGKESS